VGEALRRALVDAAARRDLGQPEELRLAAERLQDAERLLHRQHPERVARHGSPAKAALRLPEISMRY
jgi:hypothetical protein